MSKKYENPKNPKTAAKIARPKRRVGKPRIHKNTVHKTISMDKRVWEDVRHTAIRPSGIPCFSSGANRAFSLYLGVNTHLGEFAKIGDGDPRLGILIALDAYRAMNPAPAPA